MNNSFINLNLQQNHLTTVNPSQELWSHKVILVYVNDNFYSLLPEMCTVFIIETNWFRVYLDAHIVADITK